ncbi:ATP-binding protein [Kitasatospora sp. YST-16]|uniref:ATP-binding protein n=1 Tax=Kitasatospora sp. YST-16 TaxID=2998080 RepID=UPI0022841B97|nr:ATP-binding protein [Kitasatospora sp. YST-16]WAL70503.1 ATP-binding protein [Kitasatospora sp. YST-16]WNW36543.1 ATP-binding protein [Streptomyces sp. Li-HN-5-13]
MDVTVQGLRLWEQEFPATPASARLARGAVRRSLLGWGWAPERIDDMVLICSELVTNAIRHACRAGEVVPVRLQEIDGDCWLEVRDNRSELRPRPRPAGVRVDGQGLLLVADLSDDWGVTVDLGAKTVWARLSGQSQHSDVGEAA